MVVDMQHEVIALGRKESKEWSPGTRPETFLDQDQH